MARLESQIKAGFFPTPPEIVKMICTFIRADEPTGRLLDPCCGAGNALVEIANGLQVEAKTYGIELDENRAEQAKKKLTKVVVGDLFRARTKVGSHSLLFLNSPYDDSGDEDKRLEHKFLTETTKYLKTGGLLIYIIPQIRLIKKTARYLSSWFEKFLVYRFPGKSYDAFGQIVLFAVKKQKTFLDEATYERLAAVPVTKLKELSDKKGPVYTIPPNTIAEKAFYLHSLDLNIEELQQEVDDCGAWWIAKQMMYPPMKDVRSKVLMPLRKGHLAILVACGLCDGAIEKNGKKLLIKGVARKEKIITTEHNGKEIIEKSTDIIKVGIKCLNLKTGELINVE